MGPSDAISCDKDHGHLWFSHWLVAYLVPSHNLRQCSYIVNMIKRNKLQWNIIAISKFHSSQCILKMSSTEFQPFCPRTNELNGKSLSQGSLLIPVFLSVAGQGGTGKRAVYEPDGAQRCKQVVCSRNWAVAIVVIFCFLVVTIAVIAAFARPNKNVACIDTTAPTPTDAVVPTEAIATNGEKFPWDSIKLPRTVKPQNYDLTIHPNLTTFHFSGTVSIDIHVKESTPFVVFHAKKLNITSYKMYHFQSTKSLPISRFLHYPAHEQYYLELERRLQQRSQYTMMMTFEGYLSDLMVGFYRSSYTTVDGEQRWVCILTLGGWNEMASISHFTDDTFKRISLNENVRISIKISLNFVT